VFSTSFWHFKCCPHSAFQFPSTKRPIHCMYMQYRDSGQAQKALAKQITEFSYDFCFDFFPTCLSVRPSLIRFWTWKWQTTKDWFLWNSVWTAYYWTSPQLDSLNCLTLTHQHDGYAKLWEGNNILMELWKVDNIYQAILQYKQQHYRCSNCFRLMMIRRHVTCYKHLVIKLQRHVTSYKHILWSKCNVTWHATYTRW